MATCATNTVAEKMGESLVFDVFEVFMKFNDVLSSASEDYFTGLH